MFKSSNLTEILSSELNNGNQVVENSSWLPKCKKLIILKRRFSRVYEHATYREVADSHYWFAEYVDGDECLACKFEHC